MPMYTPQLSKLLQCVLIALGLISAVEYFKYSTRIHYDWFHCTPVEEPLSGSAIRLYARGGPSCDKRGEVKTIIKRITRDYEPSKDGISFCIKENMKVGPVHYPVHEDKGEPGYVAYVGYDRDSAVVQEYCENATILHM